MEKDTNVDMDMETWSPSFSLIEIYTFMKGKNVLDSFYNILSKMISSIR